MNENTLEKTRVSGEEQMQNGNVVAGSGLQADSTTNHNQVGQGTVEPNPVKREPYNGTKKLTRIKAESMDTINACNGQIGRVDLRAAYLINSHDTAKAEYVESSDFEAKRGMVLADKKVVAELSDMKGYKSELESRKNELLKTEETEINSYSFEELSW